MQKEVTMEVAGREKREFSESQRTGGMGIVKGKPCGSFKNLYVFFGHTFPKVSSNSSLT